LRAQVSRPTGKAQLPLWHGSAVEPKRSTIQTVDAWDPSYPDHDGFVTELQMASSLGHIKRQPAGLGLPALHTSGSEDGRAAGEGAFEALPRLVAQFGVERVYGDLKLAEPGDFNLDAEFLDAGCRPKMRLDGARFGAASGHFKETVAGDLTELNGFGARADDACRYAFSRWRFLRASTAAARNQAHAG
jgi:hypothetical protein